MVLKNEKWEKLVLFVSNQFGSGEKLDLQAILFLIGINELGQGYREFTKNEKLISWIVGIGSSLAFVATIALTYLGLK